ncbi:MAG TPA: NUDIX hydrolase [Mycobacteriales bacterium]|nr:NUDIX hydrolase [Mycobacteriales bacterium]
MNADSGPAAPVDPYPAAPGLVPDLVPGSATGSVTDLVPGGVPGAWALLHRDLPLERPETDAPAPASATLVQAAGAVCWRVRDDRLEVLLVHRPRYDDWSWPKGKLEPGEPEPVAAVREVAEETGLTIVLGRRLPTARYRLSDVASKTVSYWAAHVPVDAGSPAPRPDEVDLCEWMPVEEADRRLTRRGDRAQLQALSAAHSGSELHTWPFIVVRHGHARPKSAWGRADAERPLVGAGRQQALFLAPLLLAWNPRKIFCSPWKRCVQSIEPYVKQSGAKVRTKGRLSEDGHRRDRSKTADLVAKHLRKGRPVLICTHRPVLGTVLGVLAGHAGVGRSRDLPLQDPFLQPGEVLVAHVSVRSGRVVAVERHTSATA